MLNISIRFVSLSNTDTSLNTERLWEHYKSKTQFISISPLSSSVISSSSSSPSLDSTVLMTFGFTASAPSLTLTSTQIALQYQLTTESLVTTSVHCSCYCKLDVVQFRPRHRWLEAFTTDAKIIQLISRCVVIFTMAPVWQIFDGDCDAADLKKISGVILPDFRLCGFLDKGTDVFPVDKVPHYVIALTVSSLSLM